MFELVTTILYIGVITYIYNCIYTKYISNDIYIDKNKLTKLNFNSRNTSYICHKTNKFIKEIALTKSPKI